ncbi:MAG TPA: response regulator [Thermoanaerobaculia bacterium]|nr:response regulator [Thermoanaerobaculia bacterium]
MEKTSARILVVDDDESILLLMRNILREFQFEPLTARSGEEAISLARQSQPHLVLLDMRMPGMDGHDVIGALRAEPELTGVPILILSGERLTQEQIASCGAAGAIQKPFDLTELLEEIRRHAVQA